ncbi:hypothetical protein MBLNU13_g05175t1 [Cladosporium sp. NU13]
MSASPIPTVPSVRSRNPNYASNQAELDAANDWLTPKTLITSTCPITAVTRVITTETSIGKTILSKYDLAKLQNLYGTMRTTERIHIVDDMRTEVHSRQEKAQKWREVMEMVATEQSVSESKATEEWESLKTACKEALKNTVELQARLPWCERNFESGKLTPAVIAERRVWDKGAEIELRGKV